MKRSIRGDFVSGFPVKPRNEETTTDSGMYSRLINFPLILLIMQFAACNEGARVVDGI